MESEAQLGGDGQGTLAMMPFGKALGAQFEISVDSKPRSYRDRKAVAIEAAEYLKWKHPHSDVVVKDLVSGKTTAVTYKPEATPAVRREAEGRKSWR